MARSGRAKRRRWLTSSGALEERGDCFGSWKREQLRAARIDAGSRFRVPTSRSCPDVPSLP